MSIMPKRFREKAKGTFVWAETKQSSDKVSVHPEGISEQMIVYILLSLWTAVP